MKEVLVYLGVVNMIAFVVYGIDKWKAINHRFRIRESMLVLLAVIGGTVGAFIGMQVFHHKTKKPKFKYGIPIIFVIQAVISAFLIFS